MQITADNVLAAVQRLVDEAEIKRVLFQYAHYLDAAEPEKMLPLFTSDLYVSYGNHGAEGPEAYLHTLANDKTGIAAFFAGTSHHVSNVVIDFVDEDTAQVRSVLYAYHNYHRERPDGIVYGQYHDVFKRTEDGWKIQRREMQTAGVESFHAKFEQMLQIPRTGRV
jgi:hypothetical protein